MNPVPEELSKLVILLGFLLPPLVAVFKGLLKLDKKKASIAVIIVCLIFATAGAILMNVIMVGDAIVTIMWKILEAAVWILLVAYALYKIVYQALGLDEWIVLKMGGNNT